jgi:sulfur carrier protein
VRVIVNGKGRDVASGATVEALIEELGLSGPYTLVERNGEPVERSRYVDTDLADGDVIVLARPVAGG